MTEQSVIEQTIDHVASRMTPAESAEETLDRIEKYVTSPFLAPQTATLMVAAVVRNWRKRGEIRRSS